MAKLTARQFDVIEKMQNGWELGFDEAVWGFASIQKGLIGHGGESKRIFVGTFRQLHRKGLITRKNPNITEVYGVYILTQKGKEWKNE